MVTGNELAGGIVNSPLLRRQRRAVVTGWPLVFFLAEYDHAANWHHKVDLAAGRPLLPGQKPVTCADKPGNRSKFGNLPVRLACWRSACVCLTTVQSQRRAIDTVARQPGRFDDGFHRVPQSLAV